MLHNGEIDIKDHLFFKCEFSKRHWRLSKEKKEKEKKDANSWAENMELGCKEN